MDAVTFGGEGGVDVIEYGEHPEPTVGPDDVLVDVKAGALNHLDVWVRKGLPGLEIEYPHVQGADAAGVVAETGENVDRFESGDRVAVSAGLWCGTCRYCRAGEEAACVDFRIIGEHVAGVHAELAAVPERNLVTVPEGVDWTTAAAAPLVFQTAWRMVISRGDLRQGETMLVLGASGGVGHAAVQIADNAGAEVIATASSDEKLDHARRCGADRVVDYTETDLVEAVRDATDGAGVDMVVDHVGAATWEDSIDSLAKCGRLVTCGATSGTEVETNVRKVFWNHLDVRGSTMASPGEVDEVLPLVWDGTFEPHVRRTLPMSDAAHGHELLENREGFGKVVLVPDSER